MAKITTDIIVGNEWMLLPIGSTFVEVSEIIGGEIRFRFGEASTSIGAKLNGTLRSDEPVFVKADNAAVSMPDMKSSSKVKLIITKD